MNEINRYGRPVNRCEGRTVPLINWKVELCEPSGEWVLVHYVGGEDYETYGDWFDTLIDARIAQKYLNNTLPPQGYTHYFDVE